MKIIMAAIIGLLLASAAQAQVDEEDNIVWGTDRIVAPDMN